MKKYIVTGTDRSGKRFRIESESFSYCNSINVYKGSMWLEQDGKRRRIKVVRN